MLGFRSPHRAPRSLRLRGTIGPTKELTIEQDARYARARPVAHSRLHLRIRPAAAGRAAAIVTGLSATAGGIAAKALGLAIPSSLLPRADQVIE